MQSLKGWIVRNHLQLLAWSGALLGLHHMKFSSSEGFVFLAIAFGLILMLHSRRLTGFPTGICCFLLGLACTRTTIGLM